MSDADMSEIRLTDENLRAYANLTALGCGIVDHDKVFPAVIAEILETREFLRWLAEVLGNTSEEGRVWDWDGDNAQSSFSPTVARYLAMKARRVWDHLERFGAHEPEEMADLDERTGARGDA